LPLQENLGGEAGKGVLTRVELDTVAALGVEADKRLKEEEVPLSLVLQLHKNDMSMRNTKEERTDD
jgi:hypothetical protein